MRRRDLRQRVRIRIIVGIPAALALVAAAAVPASAQGNPRVQSAACTASVSRLECSGKAVGSPANPQAYEQISADVVDNVQCSNLDIFGSTDPSLVFSNPEPLGNGFFTTSPVTPPPVGTSVNGAVCTSQGRWHPILVTYGNVVLHIQQPEGTDVATEDIGSNAAP